MHIARYEFDGEIHYGAIEGDTITRIEGSPFDRIELTSHPIPLLNVRLLCPVHRPRIFGVGLNYIEHIRESGSKTPEIPLLFMKPSTTAIGPGDPILYPKEAQNLHFEAELAVVIGRAARRILKQQALEHVLGYTCANDISERVIQSAEMEMGSLLIGKGYDTFCPIGPVIATGLDPTNLRLGARVNGVDRQSSSTSDLLFSVADLVSYLSTAITLLPGDIIITGTPSGVGPLVPGDEVEVFVESVGTLQNTVVREQ